MNKKIVILSFCLFTLYAQAQSCRKDTVTKFQINSSNVKSPYYRTINSFNSNDAIIKTTGQNYTTGQWVNSIEEVSTYNLQSKVINKTVRSWVNNSWENMSKTDVEFNTSGLEVEKNSYTWNNSNNTWMPSQSLVTVYDGNNFVNSLTERQGYLTTWVNLNLTNYTRDMAGNALQTENLKWNATNQTWDKQNKIIRSFDVNNNVLTQEQQNWISNAYSSSTKITYTYNANKKEISRLTQNWTGISWADVNRLITNYNASNIVTRTYVDVYTGPQDGWKTLNSTNYIYSSTGKIMQTINSSFTIPAQIETVTNKIVNTYNSIDLLIQESTFDLLPTSLTESSRKTITYNANNDVNSIIKLGYNSSLMNLFPIDKIENTYNSENILVAVNTSSNFNINTGAFQTNLREEYACGVSNNNASISRTSANELLIYPNPASSQLFISHNKNSKIEIINSMGCVVFTHQLIEGSVEINTSNFANGIYFVKLRSAQQELIQKLLILN